MTVYRGFLTITKRNIRMVILYLIIFLSIAVLVQKATGGNMDEFEQDEKNREALTLSEINGNDCPLLHKKGFSTT